MTTRAHAIAPALLALAGLFSLAAAMGTGRFAFTPVLPSTLQEGLIDVAQGGWVAAANYAGYLAGAASAWAFAATSVWCLGALAVDGRGRAAA